MGMLQNITGDYNPVEQWMYNHLIAPAIAQDFVDHLKVIEGDIASRFRSDIRVLDVGCGGGHILREMRRRYPDFDLTGIDISPGMISYAGKLLDARNDPGIRLVCGDATRLPFRDCEFDMIFSSASLKHWRDRKAGILEAVRVARPGGLVLIVEIDRDCSDESASGFVEGWKVPGFVRGLCQRVFRKYVLDRSLSITEARGLVQGIDALCQADVTAVKGQPVFLMSLTKEDGGVPSSG